MLKTYFTKGVLIFYGFNSPLLAKNQSALGKRPEIPRIPKIRRAKSPTPNPGETKGNLLEITNRLAELAKPQTI